MSMTSVQLGGVLRQLRRLGGTAADPLPDGRLLERFLACRDGDAFAELVRRHGPMVLGVCGSVLGDGHEAEDAFQAAFLALARKAGSIRRPEALGSWLFGVAYHAALRARATATRRRAAERKVSAMTAPDPLLDLTLRELRAVLYEELHRLPEKIRAPLVLCYLEGLTRDAAACRLGCSSGAVRGRLEQGRNLLRVRLSRRGLAVPAGLAAAALGPNPAGAVPVKLADLTTRAALADAAGPTAARVASDRVIFLAEGVTKAMSNTRLKLATLFVLLASAAVFGALALFQRPAAARTPGSAVKSAPVPSAAGRAKKGTQPKSSGGATSSKSGPAPKGKPGPTMTVTGRVRDAAGKPVATAAMAVLGQTWSSNRLQGNAGWSHPKVMGQAKTDGKGCFRLAVARTSTARYGRVVVLAGHPGFGLGLVVLDPDVKKPRAEIRLSKEEILKGRLVDSQGIPAAGVRVRVTEVSFPGRWQFLLYPNFQTVPKDLAPWPPLTVTDARGRFRVRGLGPEATVSIDTEHPGFARHTFAIKPADRKGGKEVRRALVTRTISGTVTYADTGKPVPGARLVVSSQVDRIPGSPFNRPRTMEARADARGRFRLSPYLGNYFDVAAYPVAGQPYLRVSKSLKWPRADVVKQEVKLALERGILLKGKVTEKPSGKPVAGAAVSFQQRWGKDNRFYRHDLRFEDVLTGPDGRFQLVVWRGPGHLLVNGPTPDYLKTEISTGALYGSPIMGRRHYLDGLAPLNLKPQPGPHRQDVTLRRGVTLTGKVVGRDGKPVRGGHLLCRTYLRNGTFQSVHSQVVKEFKDGRFELPGCDPGNDAEVFFIAARNKLGAVVKLSPKGAKGKPVTVRLKCCGTARARLVDARGKPLARFRVHVEMIITPGASWTNPFAAKVPVADVAFMSWFDPKGHKNGNLRTDAQGRVSFPTLVPGATYWVLADPDGRGTIDLHKAFRVKAGKVLDLGDLTLKKD
jgi:RNA polymerase sigma factor (sigma-70 family)